MLKNKLKSDLIQAMRDKDETKKDILRVVIGDIESTESRENKEMSDEKIEKLIRKMVSSNEEVLRHKQDDSLVKQNEILDTYLPKMLSQGEIYSKLCDIVDDIKLADGGKAIGLAMKHLKQQNLNVDGKDVTTVVNKINGEV